MKGRKITRADAADIYYETAKMNTFYNGHIPKGVSFADVHSRLELVTKAGKRRKVQGMVVNANYPRDFDKRRYQ